MKRTYENTITVPEPPTKLADTIEVIRSADHVQLIIDGQPFPWHITSDGVSTSVITGELPAVTLTIMADNVTVTNRFAPAE